MLAFVQFIEHLEVCRQGLRRDPIYVPSYG